MNRRRRHGTSHAGRFFIDSQRRGMLAFRYFDKYQIIALADMAKPPHDVAKIFKTLSDENRLKILLYIYKRGCKCEDNLHAEETCMRDLSKSLHITLPTISHHMKELLHAGLIVKRKQGRFLFCKVNESTIQVINSFLYIFDEKRGKRKSKRSRIHS